MGYNISVFECIGVWTVLKSNFEVSLQTLKSDIKSYYRRTYGKCCFCCFSTILKEEEFYIIVLHIFNTRNYPFQNISLKLSKMSQIQSQNDTWSRLKVLNKYVLFQEELIEIFRGNSVRIKLTGSRVLPGCRVSRHKSDWTEWRRKKWKIIFGIKKAEHLMDFVTLNLVLFFTLQSEHHWFWAT